MADFDLTQSGQEIQNILDGAAMQTDLTAEIERAEQAEQQLQGNIDIEETRAKAAEKQNADDIDVIEGKIPAAASSENQLADKAFVNSSIATATATYRGAYNLVSDLHLTIDATEQQIAAALAGAISTADNNDYCFVQVPTADATPTQIAAIERYKFNGTAWAYEFTLNNSGFTADQWAALNSGITTGLVAKLAALPTNDELTLLLGGKQDVLTFDNVPTEGSNNPVKSGGVKSAIDSEKERAQGAEQANAGNIAQIIAMIPAAASSENQLADKNFVNSSIATNTATYRGAYNEVSDLSLTVDATHEQIATALAGEISTADNNDYCFVQIPTADATPTQIAAIERYKFNGTAWAYEYTLNNSGFTADQWAAINSGITSGLVAKLAALPTNDDLVAALAGKQPMLTFDNVPTENSTNPVKSGGVYAAIAEEAGTRAAAIAAIVALIPSAASALNQLADKAFVNSSISTATAVFKGTFNVVADLELNYNASQAQIALMLGSKIASADNNDYCFVQIPTSNETPLEIARTDRYKYNGTTWAYEYTLNNSGFTAAQWAAINSGITSLLKDKLIDLPTATELATQLAAKQNALTFDTTPTEGSTNPVTSDGIHAAINVEKERAETAEETLQTNIDLEYTRALAVEQGLQDDYDDLYALYQTLEGGSIIPVAAADWPVSNPQQNVIYRVANSATPTAYSDYMYNGTNTLLLATFTFPGIDSEPTPNSTNLVTSGGVYGVIMENYNKTVSEGAELIPDSIISDKYISADGSLINNTGYSIKVYNVSSEIDYEPYIKKKETPGIGVAAALWCQNPDGTEIIQIVSKVEGGVLEFYNKPVGANYLLVNSIPTMSQYDVTVFSTNNAGEGIENIKDNIKSIEENLEDIYADVKKAGFEITPTSVLSGKYLNINGVFADQPDYSVKVYDFSNEVEGENFFRIGKTPGIPNIVCESVWCQNIDGSGIVQILEIQPDSESRIYTKPANANFLLQNTIPSLEEYNPKVCTAITNNVPQFIVDCYGDSLTYAGVYETTLASLISENIRYTKVNNYGVGGQKTAEILRRYGSIPMPIYEKVTIPASGSVTIKIYTPYEVSSYAGLLPEVVQANVNPVMIAGVKGNITDETSLENNIKQYTFTRLESGSTVNVSKNTIVSTKGMYERLPDVTIFYAGTNDDIDSQKTLIVDELKKATERVSNGKFLVLGLHRERSDSGLDFTIQDVINFNKDLLDTFGSKFIDVLSYMNECALSDAGITPTQEDIQRISEGKCPSSITTDGLHFTTKGYELVGLLIYRSILSNGYCY